MNDFSDEINKILRLAGVQLNEDNEYIPFILPDPSYKQFHDFFRIFLDFFSFFMAKLPGPEKFIYLFNKINI